MKSAITITRYGITPRQVAISSARELQLGDVVPTADGPARYIGDDEKNMYFVAPGSEDWEKRLLTERKDCFETALVEGRGRLVGLEPGYSPILEHPSPAYILAKFVLNQAGITTPAGEQQQNGNR
ncbi:MAG: hypothetical protein ABH864_06315 [archaeon]